MNESKQANKRPRRMVLATMLGAAFAGLAGKSFAFGGPGGFGGRHHGFGGGDPATMAKRIELMVRYRLASVNASETMVRRLLEFPYPRICRHLVAAELLGALNEHGYPIAAELISAAYDAHDDVALDLLSTLETANV